MDANGAWSVDEARAAIAALAPFDLQLVEQPCRTLEELALLRAEVDVPLAADESIAGPDDVRVAAELRACDAVNVKLASSGGFGAAREAVRAARYSGLEPYLSSTLDGPVGHRRRSAAGRLRAPVAGVWAGHAGAVRRPAGPRAPPPAHGADGRARRAPAWAWSPTPRRWRRWCERIA